MKRWQRLTVRWTELVFPGKLALRAMKPKVRALRFLEEATELCQAVGITTEEATLITKQVYSKPKGEDFQELGGVMITVACLAESLGLDCKGAFWKEFERIMDPKMIEKVRNRNLLGDKIGMKP